MHYTDSPFGAKTAVNTGDMRGDLLKDNDPSRGIGRIHKNLCGHTTVVIFSTKEEPNSLEMRSRVRRARETLSGGCWWNTTDSSMARCNFQDSLTSYPSSTTVTSTINGLTATNRAGVRRRVYLHIYAGFGALSARNHQPIVKICTKYNTRMYRSRPFGASRSGITPGSSYFDSDRRLKISTQEKTLISPFCSLDAIHLAGSTGFAS